MMAKTKALVDFGTLRVLIFSIKLTRPTLLQNTTDLLLIRWLYFIKSLDDPCQFPHTFCLFTIDNIQQIADAVQKGL